MNRPAANRKGGCGARIHIAGQRTARPSRRTRNRRVTTMARRSPVARRTGGPARSSRSISMARANLPAPVRSARWATNWLPDGRLLIVSEPGLLRGEPDESRVPTPTYATSRHARGTRSPSMDAATPTSTRSASTSPTSASLTSGTAPARSPRQPDGRAREVADDVAFPNGMVVTPDNRTLIVAESLAGRLTAFDIDAEGSLSNRRGGRAAIAPDRHLPRRRRLHLGVHRIRRTKDCARVREGGEVLERIQLDRFCFARDAGGYRPPARCSCLPPSGVAPRTSTTSSLRGPARSSSSRRPAPGVGWP